MRMRPSEISQVMSTAASQYGLISHRQALCCGLDDTRIHRLLRRREWVCALPDVYAVRPLAAGTDSSRSADGVRLRRAVKAAQLALGPAAVASGPTAARLWGVQGLPRWDGREVHIALPAPCGRGADLPGVRTSTLIVGRHEADRKDRLRLTSPGRTLRDTVPTVDRATAVALMDSALYRGLLTWRELLAQPSLNACRPGAEASEPWWGLADPRASTPLETRIRLLCTDAGLPPDDLYPQELVDGKGPLPGRPVWAPLWWRKGALIVDPVGAVPPRLQEELEAARRPMTVLRPTWDDLARPGALTEAVAAVVAAGAGP
ncbi:transcriptional regulator [Nocardiopsis sp. RSe5-2]|uniref:Transcriptional regulator n=1 Tax=Nocardiopsis endophytica TaxID=3018445 RepID=A0ABT4U5F4_9ACTN|nr:transcriptional regulator [Nocardiopsis endophytica]MDA2811714.1 transcriptional regulator [Nocardiopsis endophytica]